MKDEIMSLMADFGEFSLDYFIQDGNIKDFPIFGSVFSMVKIGVDVRDRIFIYKMVDYLKKALIYGHTSRISS